MDQELFKAIFKLEGDNTSLLASLTEVNSKFKEQNDELKKQQIHLKTLTDREAALIKGRAEAQNPTQIVKYNKLLTENKTKIDEVKKSMENLTVTEQKNAKVTEDLGKKIVTAFNVTQITAAKNEVEKLNKAFESTEIPTVSIRKRLKELKDQLAITDDDEEFLKLTIEAGKLESKINDIREAAQIFATSSPFVSVSRGLKGVAASLLSLDFEGAATKAKLLSKAASQITFKSSLQGVKDIGSTLASVGASLLKNPLFLIGAAIAVIITNFDKLKTLGGPIGDMFRGIGNVIEFVTESFSKFTDAIGLTTNALDKLQTGRLKTLKAELEETAKLYTTAAGLLRAGGDDMAAEAAEKERLRIIVKGLDEQIKVQGAMFARMRGLSEEQIREEIKKVDDLQAEREDALNEIAKIEIAAKKRDEDLAKEAAKLEKARSDERIKRMQDFLAKRAELEEELAAANLRADSVAADAISAKLAQHFEDVKKAEQTEYDFEREQKDKRIKLAFDEFNEKKALDEKAEADRKKLAADQIIQIETITNATLNAASQILSVEAQKYEKLSSLQEKRVDDAKNIADKGNAELLELEQKRLDDLNQQREQYVRRQQALAVVELIANTAIAISKAAAQTGAFAVVGISAALIALAGGLAQARSMASQAAFYDGGFTGEGDPTQVSSNLGKKPYTYHKGEFVFNHEKTGRYKDIFQGIHTGNIDLNDWKNKVQAFESMKLFPQQREIDIAGLEKRMDRVITAIDSQSSSVNIDENGWMIRLKSIQTRNDFIKRHLARG